MFIDIPLGILTLVGFTVAMVFTVVAILDLLGLTNISGKLRSTAPSLLVGAIGILVIPYLSAIGRSVSEFWGVALTNCFLLFIFCMVFINRRSRTRNSS